MLISMNWVNDFVDLSGLDLEKLIHQFTLSTAEVEDVYHMGGDIENVVVARILSVENHPDSKKLHLLKAVSYTHLDVYKRQVLSRWLVIAAAITVGLNRLPTSFCTISTGRTPPCSLPTTGLRSA